MKRAMLGAFLWCFVTQGWAEPFRENHPDSYTVVKDDTLWDIAGRFLENPWNWPEVWEKNPQIHNPDLIYPGDVIHLVFVDGKSKLTVSRGESGRTIKLSPTIRSTPIEQAIPTIPLNTIRSFLNTSRVVDNVETLKSAPYVLSNGQDRVISGAGDTLYARGSFSPENKVHGVYRQSKGYKDPKTGEFLGILAESMGTVVMEDLSGDVATMNVNRASEELRVGDRLLEIEAGELPTAFYPSSPKNLELEGNILDVLGGVTQIGPFSSVLINRGTRDDLKVGNVLAIYRSKKIKDKLTNRVVVLPPSRVGLLMVYRTYEKMSFGVVMEASMPLSTTDIVRAP